MDPVTVTRLGYGALFAALAALIVFVQILPFRMAPGGLPGPALLPLLAFAWVVRRPDLLPAPLVAVVMLAADILFMRPLGLQAALVVLAVEFLRSRLRLRRDPPFLAEWAVVGCVVATIALLEGMALTATLLDPPAVGQVALHVVITVAAYPLVVLATAMAGVRRAAPGSADALGQRL